MIRVVLFAAALVCAGFAARAQGACADRQAVIDKLADKYGEHG